MRYPEPLYFFKFLTNNSYGTQHTSGKEGEVLHTMKNKLHSFIVDLPICNSYLIQTKAQETGVIYSVMVEQLCIKQAV